MYVDIFLFWATLGLSNAKVSLRKLLPDADLGNAAKWLAIKMVISIPMYIAFLVSPLIFEWSPLALIAVDNKEAYMIAASRSVDFPLFLLITVPRMMILDQLAVLFGRSLIAHKDGKETFDQLFDNWLWRRLKRFGLPSAWMFFYIRGGSFFAFALLIRMGVSVAVIWRHNLIASILYASAVYWFGFAALPHIIVGLTYTLRLTMPALYIILVLVIIWTIRSERSKRRLVKVA